MNIDINKLMEGMTSFGQDAQQGTLGLSNPIIAAQYQNGGNSTGAGFDWTQQAYGPEAMGDMSLGQADGGMMGGIFSDSGMLSKDNLAMGGDLLGIGTGLMGMYNSFQDRNMMEDMIGYGKDTANRDLANTALLTNQRLDDRANAKNAFNAGVRPDRQYQHVDGSAIT